jgi:NAD/NADP transhydrogenase beta subunit
LSVADERGAEVRFAIHPMAGRLPGHRNVLRAGARVSCDVVPEKAGSWMLFGDMKKMVEEVLASLREGAAG